MGFFSNSSVHRAALHIGISVGLRHAGILSPNHGGSQVTYGSSQVTSLAFQAEPCCWFQYDDSIAL